VDFSEFFGGWGTAQEPSD